MAILSIKNCLTEMQVIDVDSFHFIRVDSIRIRSCVHFYVHSFSYLSVIYSTETDSFSLYIGFPWRRHIYVLDMFIYTSYKKRKYIASQIVSLMLLCTT